MTDENVLIVVPSRDDTVQQLRYAIDQGGLHLHYQPIVELRTRRTVGFEALVRWEHPALGLLFARQFIGMAEDSGLIGGLDRWVVTEACRQVGQWASDFPKREFLIRVNMSATTLTSSGLIEDVAESLNSVTKGKWSSRVGPPRLGIEITERADLGDLTSAAHVVLSLKSMGVEVGADNFGSGRLSMTTLSHLPLDFIKVSASFVRNAANDFYDRAIVQSCIRMAAGLDIGVIANGLEDVPAVDELLTLGCLIGQGHVFEYPMEAIAVNHYLSGETSS